MSDHISLGVLTRVFPPYVIDEVLAECGRVEVRHRLLPARVVVYYVLGLALFSTSSYEEVMRMLVAGHSWASGWSREWSVPTKAALFQARKRLGSAPLRALFDKAVVPLTDPQVAGGFYRSWRLMSMDGLCLDAADTEANVERFDAPASSRGDGLGGAFPQVRVLGLAECGSHAIIDAAVGSLIGPSGACGRFSGRVSSTQTSTRGSRPPRSGGMVENFAVVWLVEGEPFDADVVIDTLTLFWARSIGLAVANHREA